MAGHSHHVLLVSLVSLVSSTVLVMLDNVERGAGQIRVSWSGLGGCVMERRERRPKKREGAHRPLYLINVVLRYSLSASGIHEARLPPRRTFDARHHCRPANQGKDEFKLVGGDEGPPTCAVPGWGQPTRYGDGSHRCGGDGPWRACSQPSSLEAFGGGKEAGLLIGLLLSLWKLGIVDGDVDGLCSGVLGELGCQGLSAFCHCTTPSCPWSASIPPCLVSHPLGACWPDGPVLDKYASFTGKRCASCWSLRG